MENYTALIIDLKKSKSYELEVRNSIQNYIYSVICSLNEVFSKSIAKNVQFSAGDEMQGLFLSPEAAYLYLRMFCMLVFPVEVRAGMGIGEWNIIMENASTAAQDGPVYHNARFAIKNAKDELGYSVLLYSGKNVDLYLNTLINTYFALTRNHSEYKNELMLLSELLNPIDYHQTINYNKINEIIKILSLKSKTDYYKKSKSKKKHIFFENLEFGDFKPDPVDVANNTSIFYVKSGKKRGITTQLAEILKISRQSVEKTIKAANIYEVRNLAIVTLKFMAKYL